MPNSPSRPSRKAGGTINAHRATSRPLRLRSMNTGARGIRARSRSSNAAPTTSSSRRDSRKNPTFAASVRLWIAATYRSSASGSIAGMPWSDLHTSSVPPARSGRSRTSAAVRSMLVTRTSMPPRSAFSTQAVPPSAVNNAARGRTGTNRLPRNEAERAFVQVRNVNRSNTLCATPCTSRAVWYPRTASGAMRDASANKSAPVPGGLADPSSRTKTPGFTRAMRPCRRQRVR